MAVNDPILNMKGICKVFPGVKALSNVDFKLKRGEIHALMGENGAGKSTLIKVLTGVYKMDEGEIILDGKTIRPTSPQHAQHLGISTVYQEVNLCPNLSVAENIFIGREPKKRGRIDWKTMNKKADEALQKLNINIDVTKTLDNYSIAIQQMVAIARSLDISAKVLILDEPTSSLERSEVDKLFEIMLKLKSQGLGIIFVTHFLDQTYEISDRITVLRNGMLVGDYYAKSLPKIELIKKMIGKEFEELDSSISKSIKGKKDNEDKKDVYLSVRNFGKHGAVRPLDLDIYKGEVIGLAGLLGSGRTETAEILFGINKSDSGQMYVENKKVNVSAPFDAIKLGMSFCPEDRKVAGIVGDLTVRENIILALQAKRGFFKYIKKKDQLQIADKYIKLLNIATPDSEQYVKNLSGGNQQKVILARWLLTEPKFLILDEPTRGIDVGTKTEIQKMIVQFAADGMAVLFISSELEEMVRCCTTIAVMRDRRKIAELNGDEISLNNIMHVIAGGHDDAKDS